MDYKFPDSKIIIFAKAPVPGKVKTRLIGKLNEAEAAGLHQEMLAQTVETVQTSNLAPAFLYCHPDTAHNFFQLLMVSGVTLYPQRGRDLGERMCNAFKEAQEDAKSVIVIGTDCPLLDEQYLEHALTQLEAHDVVLGPAEDGGYVLVGQRGLNVEMFDDIDWGEATVLEQTRTKLKDQTTKWHELAVLWDVDRPDDLLREEMHKYF